MQVTKVTAGFQNQTAERKLFTDEELQREFDYYIWSLFFLIRKVMNLQRKRKLCGRKRMG